MKRANNLILGVFVLLIIVSLISSVSALNARVGNGKFVISNATVGDVIDRTMKIYNNNSFDVIIELVPGGNLSKYIKIIDNNITMGPDSEEDFRFTVKVPEEGRNDGEIVVKFTPANVADGKNGIAIPTSMIIFAKEGNGIIDWTSWFGGGDDDTNNNDNDANDEDDSGGGLNLIGTLLITTAVVFIGLLILLFIYSKRKNYGVKEKKGKLNTKKSKHK